MQGNLDKLDRWAKFSHMTFNEGKCEVLHLGNNNPMKYYRAGEEWLESSLAEKDLGMFFNSQGNKSHQCAQLAKKDNASWLQQKQCGQ